MLMKEVFCHTGGVKGTFLCLCIEALVHVVSNVWRRSLTLSSSSLTRLAFNFEFGFEFIKWSTERLSFWIKLFWNLILRIINPKILSKIFSPFVDTFPMIIEETWSLNLPFKICWVICSYICASSLADGFLYHLSIFYFGRGLICWSKLPSTSAYGPADPK